MKSFTFLGKVKKNMFPISHMLCIYVDVIMNNEKVYKFTFIMAIVVRHVEICRKLSRKRAEN